MNRRVRFAVLVVIALGVPAILPSAGALRGASEYDINVGVEATWHPHLREWEIGTPGISSQAPSKLINYEALLKNALFFARSDAKLVRFTLEADGTVVDTIEQRTPEGGRFGTSEFIHVVFRHVEPGSYLLRAVIIEDDGSTLAGSTALVNVEAA